MAECQMVNEFTVNNKKSIAENETENHDSLDQCIDSASAKEFYSLAQLIRGTPTRSKR